MKKYIQGMDKLIFGVITLLLITMLIPMTQSQTIEKETLTKLTSYSDGIIISGWLGENGWYRSNVQITFNLTGHINHTYYKLDDGEWQDYTVPIVVDTEGVHTVWIYLIDQGENYSDNATFKIDKTNPEITLVNEDVGFGQVKFVANVSDAVSGVWRVEFLVDDEPVFTDFEAPFESDVFWVGNHNVVAFVFDMAGNSQADDFTTPYGLNGARYLNPTEMSTTSIDHLQQNLDEREGTPLRSNVTITFTYPENGIYWNERKIALYSVPYILHGNGELVVQGLRLYRATPIKYTMTGSIMLMELYIDGTLVGIVNSPPFEFDVPVLMPNFSHFNEKIIVYGSNPGEWGSDEITIWRLFI